MSDGSRDMARTRSWQKKKEKKKKERKKNELAESHKASPTGIANKFKKNRRGTENLNIYSKRLNKREERKKQGLHCAFLGAEKTRYSKQENDAENITLDFNECIRHIMAMHWTKAATQHCNEINIDEVKS